MNYFTLFDTPVSLKVDKNLILKKYYALSRKYHPDNFTLAGIDEQQESERMTADINTAKKVLENEYKLLEYILFERKIIVPDEKYNLSPIFLGEMMDINEQLMELEFEKNQEQITKLKIELGEIENQIYSEVQHLFEQNELFINEPEEKLLKEYYYKKKYLMRIMEKLTK